MYRLYLKFQAFRSAIRSTNLYQRYAKLREELEDQKLNRVCVGEDRKGNKYYQYYNYYGLPTRREIRFQDDKKQIVNDLAFYDWLHKRDDTPPNEEQLRIFYQKEDERLLRAQEWDRKQEEMMLAFREQRKLKEQQYRKQYEQIQTDSNEILQEIVSNLKQSPVESNKEGAKSQLTEEEQSFLLGWKPEAKAREAKEMNKEL